MIYFLTSIFFPRWRTILIDFALDKNIFHSTTMVRFLFSFIVVISYIPFLHRFHLAEELIFGLDVPSIVYFVLILFYYLLAVFNQKYLIVLLLESVYVRTLCFSVVHI